MSNLSNFREPQTADNWQPITGAIINIDGVFISEGLHVIEKVPGGFLTRHNKNQTRFLFIEVKRGEGFKAVDTLKPQRGGQLEVLYALAHVPVNFVILLHSDPYVPVVGGAREVRPVEYQIISPNVGIDNCLGPRIKTSVEDFKARINAWLVHPHPTKFTQ